MSSVGFLNVTGVYPWVYNSKSSYVVITTFSETHQSLKRIFQECSFFWDDGELMIKDCLFMKAQSFRCLAG